MNVKNLSALFLTASMIALSACKKDIKAPENTGSLEGETVSSNANTYDGMLETSPAIHTPVYMNVNSNVAGYWQSLPSLYSKTTKSYPLIIFIHGVGELGTALSRMNCCGLPSHLYRKTFPPKFLVNGVYHSFIVVSPQFKVRPSAAQIQSVIDHAKSKFRVDASRIYVTGLSMGGGSTWDWSVVYGQNAAAIVPVCAGTKPTTTLAANVAIKNLPIWSINSINDAVVPIQWGRDWINWVDARNSTYAPHTKLTQWSGLTHNSTWVTAFNPTTKVDGYSMYEWMLKFRRGSVPTSSTTAPAPTTTTNILPIARAGADKAIALNWNYMPTVWGNTSSDADGSIVSYRWTKISGPTSFYIQTPTLNNTKISNLVVGTYYFRLTVTDNRGGVGIDDIKITVTSK